MILDDLRTKATAALKAGQKDTAALYRLIIGMSQQLNSPNDEQVSGIIRKVIKGNTETLEVIKEMPERNTDRNNLLLENQLLSEFLPKTMSAENVSDFIKENNIDILSAKNDGQAVGVVMKALKTNNLSVDGSVVKEIIINLRSNAETS